METEFIIIGIFVIIIFVGFEIKSVRSYRKTIAKQNKYIEAQDDIIKVLMRENDIAVQKQYENIKNKLNGK
ncbi:hypothetical protein [Chryseobacterium aquaticum]|uniref:Uncharacterized protein n=1 Tax=Chryseobacterium aquaticum subsp. greenlandense TaxID=345663 RepID=A0A101CD37_9FLAO|nr:hypothetical protein [Chryseobacterium aquaticum]KUJ54018.1 hypothetical protein AR686_17680 [Chryseobacterium aquaticum subsp. greenlandense]